MNFKEKESSLKKNQTILRIIISTFFIIIIIYLYNLQILKGNYFNEIAEKNFVRIRRVEPLRGEIYDRNHRQLAINIPSIDLYLTPANIINRDLLTDFLLSNFNLEVQDIKSTINRGMRNPFQSLLIIKNLDYYKVLELSEIIYKYPSLNFQTEAGRRYINHNHFLGYIGKIDSNELSIHRDRGYNINSMIGKTGIEKKYECYLKGFYGYEVVQVDATGKSLSLFKHNLEKQAINGLDLILTIDLNLQRFIQNKFPDNRKGAVVVLDSKTGGILSYVSKPEYDQNLFTQHMTKAVWDSLLSNPDNPLLDRISQGSYSPASLFKAATAAFALDNNIVSANALGANCTGSYTIGDRTFRCWFHRGHGSLNIVDSIKKSCNVFFYDLSQKIELDLLKSYVVSNHIVDRTGIDLPSERLGFFPDMLWYQNRLGRYFTVAGHKANLSIGQGEVLLTPIQVAAFYNAIANDGLWKQPFFAKNYIGRDSEPIFSMLNQKPADFFYREEKQLNIKRETINVIKQGLFKGVDDWDGTGFAARVRGVKVYGKTGSAQNVQAEPHAWFAGFAEWEYPEITVVVLIENAEGGGGANAAPLAGEIIKYYKDNIRTRLKVR